MPSSFWVRFFAGLLAFLSWVPEHGNEISFVASVNERREAVGLEPLKWSTELASASLSHSEWMATQSHLEHADDLSVGLEEVEWALLGENVGVADPGILDPVDGIFGEMVRSPSHDRNFLEPGFDWIGVSVIVVDGRTWLTVRFADVG